ncbi:dynein light chain LC6, flagellar outer arm-like [Mercenaria mercenaria]|uniref:dynein light chain LC6, flagellar outer arm-like n=1 Tax=Mercenaria mercenaria TaxID=6596 RepID=UPI00234F575D|nr:dynein light chain LC6, flagellar outer arm-like [Mercenaria mercenaria]
MIAARIPVIGTRITVTAVKFMVIDIRSSVKAVRTPVIAGTMSERKAVIKDVDMAEDMQQDAVDCATQALEKFSAGQDIATFIQKEFNKKYNPIWNCVVGRSFGSKVIHETKHFIISTLLGEVNILLFKSA